MIARAIPCPSVSPSGRQCTMPRGVDHHGLARNDKGLGLPNLIHVDSVGWTWIDAPPPDDPGPRS